MSRSFNPGRVATLAFSLLALTSNPIFAQDVPERPPLLGELPEPKDSQQEILDLFAKVERNLKRIDRILSDAAAGEIPLDQPEESGLADLLRETQKANQSNIDDIDRILEISQNSKSSSQGQQGQPDSPPQEGDSPLDKPRDGTPQEQEQTPETPDNQSEPDSEPSEPEDSGEDPETESENEKNAPPTPTEPGSPSGVSPDGERWGELPPRVREVFRSQGGGDLPTQYRDWIDSYYRRLNQRP